MTDKENPTHYVNNKDFYAALVVYRDECKLAESLGQGRPMLSNYIGDCFMQISKGVAQKHNFRNYSYINDMISSGIEECVKRVRSFDPDKSTSPFSYFTQVVWYAFLNIIKSEKKQASRKRLAFLLGGYDTFDISEHDEDGNFNMSYSDYIQSIGDGMDEELKLIKDKKESKKKSKMSTLLFDYE